MKIMQVTTGNVREENLLMQTKPEKGRSGKLNRKHGGFTSNMSSGDNKLLLHGP